MPDPKFSGVWIPKAVFESQALSQSAKLLYGVIAGLDGSEGCYASNAYLQEVLGASERAIQTLLAELDDLKLIVRDTYRGRRVIRTVEGIALGGCKKLRGGVQKSAGEGCKKLHPYIIVDNIDNITTPTPSSEDMIPWAEDDGLKLPFSSDAFQKSWASWIDYRKELKKPLKPTTIKAQWKLFVKWGEQKSIESISQSIMNGWQGLFEPRVNGWNPKDKKPLTAKDHDEF